MHLLTSSRTISAALLLSLAACCNAQQSQYAIEHLAGNAYMYSGGGTGTFMVTPDGVAVADAPNPGIVTRGRSIPISKLSEILFAPEIGGKNEDS